MILKPFEESFMVKGLGALLQRLEMSHPLYTKLSHELQQQEAGDFGEHHIIKQLQKLSYTLDIVILHNVTIPEPIPIQLDIVVITPYDVVIIESKNIKGNIQLKIKPRQMIRTLETGERHIFNHPEIQLEEYVFGLGKFFERQQIHVDVTGVIVFPFNNAEIQYDDGEFPVLMIRELLYFLRQHVMNKRSQRKIPSKKIGNLLMESHRLYQIPPFCTYYKIDPLVIRKGVFCRRCIQKKVVRNKKNWFCPYCKMYDKTAHHQALQDYRMLINDHINTETARYFLELSNRHITKRLLQDYCTQKKGHNNQMLYQL
ncbi:NERD domain-containing protein [Lysinibacillus sp. NPDC096418]|uniref:NERD domain-containing protein n=1 Tax=Lysinibacillus sp. NPDC096418 TaxID=3364138 RepID=UPI00380DE263